MNERFIPTKLDSNPLPSPTFERYYLLSANGIDRNHKFCIEKDL
jgi:hypothetical protein